MSYEYSDPSREIDPHALPDVEVFHADHYPSESGSETGNSPEGIDATPGFYYAFGFPGCLWDSEPVGPFDTYAEALADAREGVSS
jgi:hypothetical protein